MIKDRKEHIKKVIDNLNQNFFCALSNENKAVLGLLEKFRCKVCAKPKLRVEFRLSDFFDVAIMYAEEYEIEQPSKNNWEKDFKEFCYQLMNPWPIEPIERAGLTIKPVHISNAYVKHRYELKAI